MSDIRFGNKALYLLSEKKSLKWPAFRKDMEYLLRQNKQQSLKKGRLVNSSKTLEDAGKNPSQKKACDSWRLVRDLSAMAYLDIGGKTGKIVVKIAPPILAELPFWKPVFLLTGARSPALLQTIKKSFKTAVEIKTHSRLPDTVFLKPESRSVLQEQLNDTKFQGNHLSDYIKISPRPPAWDILEFAGDLKSYKNSLDDEWFGGDKTHIKEVFDINSLKFKPFDADKNKLTGDLSLVKIYHQEAYYKYYLFSKQDPQKAEVQLDWGRFIIAERQSKTPVFKYNKRKFELSSRLPLPFIFERGLTLLSGQPPEKPFAKKAHKEINKTTDSFVFKKVPYETALLVINKLGQSCADFA